MASRLRRWIGTAWHALDFIRRALLNLLMLALLIGLAWWLLRPGAPALRENTTLVLDLQGTVREQVAAPGRSSLLRRAAGDTGGRSWRLRDLLTGLDAAAQDPNVARVLLLTDGFAGAGPVTLREIAAAIGRVRAGGKQVIAWGSSYRQPAYYLAAHADQVWLHPMGSVGVQGYGRHRNYYREAFDRFGITPHVLRAGQYKSMGETWVASAPSPQTLDNERQVLDAMWALYTGGIEKARGLPAQSIDRLIDELPQRLAASGGDMAGLAQKEGLVDALKSADELRARMIELGVAEDEGRNFRRIGFNDYLARLPRDEAEARIAVIVAQGTIRNGRAAPGGIGAESTAELIRGAREDKRVKALVLRVDSPGGSAFGAEVIRREMALTRDAGKPVVVSMGDRAASGGYYVTIPADEVIADAATLTGSIGVVAVFGGIEQALDRLGVHTGGYTTTWLAGAFDPRRPLDPRLRSVMQAGIDHNYRRFTAEVAKARQRTPEQIDAVAQGRIWSGAQAHERGLVDRLGGYREALETAAKRAQLPAGGWRAVYPEVSRGRLDRLAGWLLPGLGLTDDKVPVDQETAWLRHVLASVWPDEELAALLLSAAELEPGAPLAHCLCAVTGP